MRIDRRRLITAAMGGMSLDKYIKSLAPIAYWPLDETSGTAAINYGSLGVAANGTYNGVTLAQVAAPGGVLAPYFDGVNDFINLYSVALRNAFSGAAGTFALWFKMFNAAEWTDGTHRVIAAIRADDNNRVFLDRTGVNNEIAWFYTAGGTEETVASTAYANLGWNHMAITWSKAADEVKAYANGVQVGATLTGLGTWVGVITASTSLVGGYNTSVVLDYLGYVSRPALWTSPLNSNQIATMYSLGSV